MSKFEVGDKIAAAVRTGNHAPALRVGRIERIHDRTYAIGVRRFTIRDKDGKTSIVSEDRSVHIERDEHHTMDELYEYRMLYNAYTALYFDSMHGKAVKSWRHHDGEECFGGGWFIVCLNTPHGWVTNHYKAEYWDLFDVPEVEQAPEWDGHTPQQAAERLLHWLKGDE